MKKRFTEEQIIGFLREEEAGIAFFMAPHGLSGKVVLIFKQDITDVPIITSQDRFQSVSRQVQSFL